MALAVASKTTGGSTTPATSYNTASVAFSNSLLYLVPVWTDTGGITGQGPAISGITGGGLTWVEVVTASGSGKRMSLFRAMVASGATTQALTISAASPATIAWQVLEWTGMDTSGVAGAGAIVQSKGIQGATTSMAITLTSAITSGNASFGVFAHTTATAPTLGTGYTSIASQTSPMAMHSEWEAAGAQLVDETQATAANYAGSAAEIKPASGTNFPISLSVGATYTPATSNLFVSGFRFDPNFPRWQAVNRGATR